MVTSTVSCDETYKRHDMTRTFPDTVPPRALPARSAGVVPSRIDIPPVAPRSLSQRPGCGCRPSCWSRTDSLDRWHSRPSVGHQRGGARDNLRTSGDHWCTVDRQDDLVRCIDRFRPDWSTYETATMLILIVMYLNIIGVCMWHMWVLICAQSTSMCVFVALLQTQTVNRDNCDSSPSIGV